MCFKTSYYIQIDAYLCKLKLRGHVISKVIYFRFGALGLAVCFPVILFLVADIVYSLH